MDNSKKLMEDIPNKITQSMGIVADVNLLEKDGREYIEINVPAYSMGISYKGVYHYRSGSTKQILTGPALESFLNGKRGAAWDNMPIPAFKMDNVDDTVIKKFKELAAAKGRIESSLLNEPKEILMEKLHLVSNGYLTNAAMMLFSKDPEILHASYRYMKMIKVQGRDTLFDLQKPINKFKVDSAAISSYNNFKVIYLSRMLF